MCRRPHHHPLLAAIVCGGLALAGLSGCFTGVEGTSRINLSKKDIVATAPTQEDILLMDIVSAPLKDWQPGKRFLVADEKFRLIVDNIGGAPINVGDVLEYSHAERRSAPGGGERTLIVFRSAGNTEVGNTGTNTVGYTVEKTLDDARETFTASEVPMTVDLESVAKVGKRLVGKKLWTRSALWYDDSLQYKKGLKFAPVRVEEVVPGNAFFPLLVKFRGETGDEGLFLMNFGNSGNESRNFAKLFSLDDPRNLYKGITDEHWKAIQAEELMLGMTKEESRLSRGNPSDVDMGHNYSNAVEIWYYPDGRFLQFVDGLLIRFK